jgi:hypothetical protein
MAKKVLENFPQGKKVARIQSSMWKIAFSTVFKTGKPFPRPV